MYMYKELYTGGGGVPPRDELARRKKWTTTGPQAADGGPASRGAVAVQGPPRPAGVRRRGRGAATVRAPSRASDVRGWCRNVTVLSSEPDGRRMSYRLCQSEWGDSAGVITCAGRPMLTLARLQRRGQSRANGSKVSKEAKK